MPGGLADRRRVGVPVLVGRRGGALRGMPGGGDAELRQSELVDDLVKLGTHLRGVAETVVRVTRGGPGDELIELRRDAVDHRAGRRYVAVEAGMSDRQRAVAPERGCAGQQFEGHDAQGVDVAARSGGGADDLFGGEVGGRAEDHAGGRDARLGDRPHQSEVDQFHLTVIGDQHVLGFEVAMHQAGPVGGAQAAQHRAEDGYHRVRRHRAPFPQQLPQGAALDQLHHQIGICRVVVPVVDGDQPGVPEPRHRAGLPPEPGQELVVTGVARIHDLQRDRPFQPGVEPPVDRGHAAGRDLAVDAVAAVERPARQGVRRHRHMVGRPPIRTGPEPVPNRPRTGSALPPRRP